MKPIALIYIALGSICLLGMLATPANAQDGLPGSPAFGYGVCLNIDGSQVEQAVQTASNYGIDWLTIDFNWAKYWPDVNVEPQWSDLDRTMNAVGNSSISVMIAINNAPTWASGVDGPSSSWTSELALRLVRRYPQHLLAIELFPGANTAQGWGSTPNAQAYANLYQDVDHALRSEGHPITVVAVGLNPAEGIPSALNYLQSIYDTGFGLTIPIISLRTPAIAYPPSTSPSEVAEYTLRFYEQARQVMLNNGHQNGLIWVTRFDWRSDQVTDAQSQANWLQNAYITMRPQLYIGMASFYCINETGAVSSLLNSDGSPTAVFNAFGELIASERGYHTASSSDG